MERKELIQWVKDNGIKTEKPTHMMSTADLQGLKDLHDKAVKVKEEAEGEVKEVTMKSRILELGCQGLTKKAIEKQMKEEGFSKIRYAYIFIILKDNSVTVPKASTKGRSKKGSIKKSSILEVQPQTVSPEGESNSEPASDIPAETQPTQEVAA